MFSKTFLRLMTITCLTLCNNSNAAVDITFYKNNDCEIKCNRECEVFDGSKESLDEVNKLIGNYFKIDSITYDNNSNTINFKCMKLQKDTNCVLILKNNHTVLLHNAETEFSSLPSDLNINDSEESLPNILIDGGNNTFNELIINGFNGIKFDNIKSDIYASYHTNKFVSAYIDTK